MAWNDDNDDDYKSSRSHSGYGSSSSHSSSRDHDSPSSTSSREHFGNTSSFNTMVSDDGRFFGMELTPDMKEKLSWMYATFLPHASEWAEKFAARHGTPAIGTAAAYSVIFAKQIYEVMDNIHASARRLNDLRLSVQPLNHSGSKTTAPLSGTNEVVANARGKISGIFWNNTVQTVAGSVENIPATYLQINRHLAKAQEMELQREIVQAAKSNDINKVADGLDKKMTVGSSAIKDVDPIVLRQAKDMVIDRHRAQYEAKFKAFADEQRKVVEKEFKDLLKIDSQNVRVKIRELKRYNVDVALLDETLKKKDSYVEGRYAGKKDWDKDDLGDHFEKFRKETKKQEKHYVEEILKSKFVKRHGAFDEEWTEYGRQDRNNSRTHKEELESQFNKWEDSAARAEEERKNAARESGGQDKNAAEFAKAGSGFLSGLLGTQLRKIFGGKALEKFKQPIALDRILHLRRVMEQGKDQPPEMVAPIPDSKDKDMGYVEFVHTVFKQHQGDCNRANIGERFFEHFEKAHWNDADIQKLPDEELTAYEFAVKTIAKRIKDGRMDAIALVELVGDKQRKIVRGDGRSFGPQGAGKDDAAIKQAMLKIIDEKTAMLQAGKEQTAEEINDKLGNFIFSVEDMKHALESKEMDKTQRAFLFTVFSDVVGSDEGLCAKIGVTTERCQELRKECKETFNAMLDSAVIVLADMIEKEPQELEKKLKLTDKEKELIRSLASRVKEEGKAVADLTENREEIKGLETLVANATMTLGKEPAGTDADGKPKNFWQRLVSKAKEPKAPKKEKNPDVHTHEGRGKQHDDRFSSDDDRDSRHSHRGNSEESALFEDREEKHKPYSRKNKSNSYSERLGERDGDHKSKFSRKDWKDKPSHDESDSLRGV